MKSRFLLLFALLISDIAICENSVTFEGVGSPGFLTIEGKGAKVSVAMEVKEGKSSGTFDVDLKSFDTGIGLRNDHMLDKYLEVQKYPSAKLVLDPVALPKQGFANWTGELNLHGVTNKVGGVADVQGNQIKAKFNINMSDFKIKKAIFKGVGLEDKISILVVFDSPSS